MGKSFDIVITLDGQVRYLHADAAVRLTYDIGVLKIQRASRVEPDENGNWWADLTQWPNGPKLGPFPPDQRAQALDAEAEWLRENILCRQEPLVPTD